MESPKQVFPDLAVTRAKVFLEVLNNYFFNETASTRTDISKGTGKDRTTIYHALNTLIGFGLVIESNDLAEYLQCHPFEIKEVKKRKNILSKSTKTLPKMVQKQIIEVAKFYLPNIVNKELFVFNSDKVQATSKLREYSKRAEEVIKKAQEKNK